MAEASTTISARIPADLAAIMQALATSTNLPLSTHVRRALETYLLSQDPAKILNDLQAARQAQIAALQAEDAAATKALTDYIASKGK